MSAKLAKLLAIYLNFADLRKNASIRFPSSASSCILAVALVVVIVILVLNYNDGFPPLSLKQIIIILRGVGRTNVWKRP